MYLVFSTEAYIDIALELLISKYKYQIIDGRWITPKPSIIPEGLPEYTEENESLSWYPKDSKQYEVLRNTIHAKLDEQFAKIDIIAVNIKKDFTYENIDMGISGMMYDTETTMTKFVSDAMKDVDYALQNRSTTDVFNEIDKIPRETIFLTEERLTVFKNRLYQEFSAL